MIALCYGIPMDKDLVANDLGLAVYDEVCYFCGFNYVQDAYFCHNCGRKNEHRKREIPLADVIVGFEIAFGKPKSFSFISSGKKICVGKILSLGEAPASPLPVLSTMADLKKDIENYINIRKMPSVKKDIVLFALNMET